MADLARRGPLEDAQPIAVANTTVAVGVPIGRAIVRGTAENAFGIDLPAAPCRTAVQGECAALWLGPDEWLVLAPPRLDDAAGTIIDVSHRQVALIIEGPRAAALLNGACPLDLHLGAFPVGMCTRTVFAKAEILLWRKGEHRFHLEVARSFAGYVHGLLREIATDLA